MQTPREGALIEHSLTTPVTEVADDGKTVKGIWISPRHETIVVPGKEKRQAIWTWARYGMDFAKRGW